MDTSSHINNGESESQLFQLVQQGVKLTPMMEQYYQIKKQHPDTLLLFRMGDFYEVFFEDAHTASKVLNIAKTHRGKLAETPIPMAGIPHHAAPNYINRLTDAGMKVAICEQVEDPKMAKGIVKRAVTQIVSPGLPYDLDKTSQQEHQYLACGWQDSTSQQFFLVFSDFTTGKFFGLQLESQEEFLEQLFLHSPKEFIQFHQQWQQYPDIIKYLGSDDLLISTLSENYFHEKYTDIYIEKLIPSYQKDETLNLSPEIISPIGALAYYICSTQSLDSFSHFSPFHIHGHQKYMKITYSTLSGLEIFPRSRHHYHDSLLGFMDKTQTSMGTRRMRELFQKPLIQKKDISERQKTVTQLMSDQEVLCQTRKELSEIRDLERIMAKVSTRKANSSDLLNLSAAITSYHAFKPLFQKLNCQDLNQLSGQHIQGLTALGEEIFLKINDEMGASLDKGNLIKAGADKRRDKLANLSQNAGSELLKLEQKYRKETDISNLKVKSNNVAGYFIEVSKSHLKKVPAHFERRQTLVNSERYVTEELLTLEKEVIAAKEKLYQLERKIFDQIIQSIEQNAAAINLLALTLSNLDFFQSLAWVALQEDFALPSISSKKEMNLEAVWHPLIKASLQESFTPHHIHLDESNYFALITGPNMAGKTTVMREVAIVQFLTQLGSYVPAHKAKLSLCDQIFSRLGASDDILRGQSTFMVEMSETAEIIRHATDKSLIILDEIGRGTSTYDGLSIAWALVEYFSQKTKALTLFSTHYHELIELVDNTDGAKNFTVKTINDKGNIRFLYHLIEGGAAQSFGIHVAKLAGLPESILKRSKQRLNELELQQSNLLSIAQQELDKKPSKKHNQLDFFDSYQNSQSPEASRLEELEQELHKMDLLHTTPFEALEQLRKLKAQFNSH
jgi:DNA mismatch repair protein MutS